MSPTLRIARSKHLPRWFSDVLDAMGDEVSKNVFPVKRRAGASTKTPAQIHRR